MKINWIANPCGYCEHHNKLMSVKMVKSKNCVGLHCIHLRRYNHPWWNQLREEKQRKIERKLEKSKGYRAI